MLERLGLAYVKRLGRGLPWPPSADAIHVLNAAEQAALLQIERSAVARAALAGGLSALVSSGASALASPLTGPAYWLVVGGVSALAAGFEIVFVYRDALRSVHALGRAAGVELVASEELLASLVRAALEMPNPPRDERGVDPQRESSRMTLLAVSVLYKAKVGLTSFLLKALVRRALGRAAIRVWLTFVSVPVSAFWNGVVAYRVLREARVRTMGPSFVRERLESLLGELEPEGAEAEGLLRAVASAIVRTHDLHPNLLALYDAVRSRLRVEAVVDLDDTSRFLHELGALPPVSQERVLALLDVAAVCDGRLTRAEKRLLREGRVACGRAPDVSSAKAARRSFVRGEVTA